MELGTGDLWSTQGQRFLDARQWKEKSKHEECHTLYKVINMQLIWNKCKKKDLSILVKFDAHLKAISIQTGKR